jgi:uncharacterized protein YodC (DUF2158 family)
MKIFSEGDKVRLKTGGEEMIVRKYALDMSFITHNKKLFPNSNQPPPSKIVECEWMSGKKAGNFAEDSLVFVN